MNGPARPSPPPPASGKPLVSIVVPVYNGGSFLEECLDSVLAQEYADWECVVVDNCSTDETGEIAARYHRRDPRFRLHRTDSLLPVIENHNFAFSRIDAESRYCKILHADDRLFPECLREMVRVAEEHPSAGIVGGYTLSGKRVRCDGLPWGRELFPGTDIARLTLTGRIYPFWSPTSTLIRASLLRERGTLYASDRLHADVELMYELLQRSDFGFVHKVLTHVREHEESETSRRVKSMNAAHLSNLELFVRYGPAFLDEEAYRLHLEKRLTGYYRALAPDALEGRDREFWRHHAGRMSRIGQPFDRKRLVGAILRFSLANPGAARDALRRRLRGGDG